MKTRKTIDWFPPELLSEILKLLPAKKLSKLRVVCKLWNSVISDRNFQQDQLHHHGNKQGCKYHVLSFGEHNVTGSLYIVSSTTLKVIKDISVRNFQYFTNYSILGNVDGVLLVCFTMSNVDKGENIIFLMNPTIGKVVDIPLYGSSMKSPDVNHIGFGFDSISKNYKVVVLNLNNCRLKTKVYNLGSHSWTSTIEKRCSIENVRYLLNSSLTFTFEGGIYWLARVGRKASNVTHYLCFNLSSEASYCLKLPDFKCDGD
ncbi:putative F-box protein At1g47790 [Silene latifolia]|uniref:putative F-box protein At1g47790 n=1 Tax=Silene latifolia TaxID=37657 RepID=UPI003D77DCA4